jgi:hypothetical protein
MVLPGYGNPGKNLVNESLNDNFFSCTICKMAIAVNVLPVEAICIGVVSVKESFLRRSL